jgi:hypothetical protein
MMLSRLLLLLLLVLRISAATAFCSGGELYRPSSSFAAATVDISQTSSPWISIAQRHSHSHSHSHSLRKSKRRVLTCLITVAKATKKKIDLGPTTVIIDETQPTNDDSENDKDDDESEDYEDQARKERKKQNKNKNKKSGDDYEARRRVWEDRYGSVKALRRSFGTSPHRFWGDLDPESTRLLYHTLLPRSLLGLYEAGLMRPDELAPLAYQARKAAKEYVTRTDNVFVRFVSSSHPEHTLHFVRVRRF